MRIILILTSNEITFVINIQLDIISDDDIFLNEIYWEENEFFEFEQHEMSSIDENNLDQFGNIVYYSLKMDCYSLIIDKKEIIINQCVLLSH